MKIERLVDEFCHYGEYIKGYTPRTVYKYRNCLRTFIRNTEANDIEDLNDKLVQEFFIKGRTERAWKVATYRTYHKTLKVFFRWCIKEGHLKQNLTDDIELPKLEKQIPKGLKKKEALFILEVVYNLPYLMKFQRYRNYAIFSMFLYTGIRKQELLNLKLTDVDTENRSLFIRQGKGSKDRIIPLHSKLVERLDRYLMERKKAKKMNPYFFTSAYRDMGFTDSGLKRITEKIKKVSRQSFTIHRLRHTFATLMLEGGCDIYSLSKMMGHSDIKTTTIYLSASAEHLRKEMTKHPLDMAI